MVHRLPLKLFSVCLTCLLAACVTVNIYFPAAEVQKTADEIVDDVYGPSSPEEDPSSQDNQSHLRRFLDFFGPGKAYAAEKATQVSNAAIRGLKAQMRQNHEQLKPFYDSGALGITNQGMLTIRDSSSLSLAEKGKLRSLVEKDNEARRQLYQEVARALDLKSNQVSDVQDIFARTWREKADSGWWIQKDGGQWVKK
jgi:uncharacterized protein YdbL (DUF1318 family)